MKTKVTKGAIETLESSRAKSHGSSRSGKYGPVGSTNGAFLGTYPNVLNVIVVSRSSLLGRRCGISAYLFSEFLKGVSRSYTI